MKKIIPTHALIGQYSFWPHIVYKGTKQECEKKFGDLPSSRNKKEYKILTYKSAMRRLNTFTL